MRWNSPISSCNLLTSPSGRIASIAGLVLLATLGCIKREENITVLPDGSTFLAGYFEGDPSDFRDGDALPIERSGWRVEEHLKSDSNQKKTLIRTAQRMIPANAALPDSYAAQNDPVADICLRFPTTVKVERRPDGDYYHFRRVYRGRRYSQFIFWQKTILESDEIQKISNRSPEEMTESERVKLAEAFIASDTRKTAEFIEDAALSMTDRLPQDAWLAALRAGLNTYEREFTDQKLTELLKSDDDAAEAMALANQTRELVVESMRQALRKQRIAPMLINEFIDAYHLSRDEFDVTEDLGDENWRVTVVLPGNIIGYNGADAMTPDMNDDRGRNPASDAGYEVLDQVTFEPGFSRVRWEFDGNRLADRDVVLAATSFVPRGK